MKLTLGSAIVLMACVIAGCSKDEGNPTTPSACGYTVSSTSQAPGATGGNFSVTITKTSGSCQWAASSNASWMTISGAASGSDTATLTVNVAPNTTTAARGGAIAISWEGGSTQIAVNQDGLGFGQCTYAFANPAQTVSASSGSSSAALAVNGSGCTWSASTDAAWLTITSDKSGTGNAAIAFSVTANPDVNPRAGSITVNFPGGSTKVTVTQEGVNSCVYTLAPATQSATAAGGSFSFVPTRNTQNGCSWTAASTVPWMTLTGPTSGLSGTTVTYDVAANAGAARTGTITVTWSGGTADLTVTQGAAITTDQRRYMRP